MRKIAIIGSGQAGLVAAHGLRKAGCSVTLYSDRKPEAWLTQSRPTGTAARFETSLAYERELGLDHWEAAAPKGTGGHLTFCPEMGNRLLTLAGRFERHFIAIDVRLQSHRWMLDLAARGGRVEVEEITIPKLEEVAAEHDLTLVATGRGGLSSLFARDEARSVYSGPQRHLVMICVKGPALGFDGIPFLPFKFNLFAPAGEAFWIPYFHKDVGPSWNCLFEAKPGGPMDRFQGAKSAKEVLDLAKTAIRDLMPWDRAWFEDAEASDEQGWLVGSFTPCVRAPVGRLPSGRVVMALGDTAMAVDPIAGQGANNGNKMARTIVEQVAARGDQPFDAAWMKDTFERFWTRHGQYSNAWTNMLLEPASAMAKAFLVAQYGSDGRPERTDPAQRLANAFVENFNDPAKLTSTFLDDAKIRAFVRETTGSFVGSVARGVPGVIRGQVRQRLGRDPGHPLAPAAV